MLVWLIGNRMCVASTLSIWEVKVRMYTTFLLVGLLMSQSSVKFKTNAAATELQANIVSTRRMEFQKRRITWMRIMLEYEGWDHMFVTNKNAMNRNEASMFIMRWIKMNYQTHENVGKGKDNFSTDVYIVNLTGFKVVDGFVVKRKGEIQILNISLLDIDFMKNSIDILKLMLVPLPEINSKNNCRSGSLEKCLSLLQVVYKRLHDAKDIAICNICFWVQNIERPKKIHDEKGELI